MKACSRHICVVISGHHAHIGWPPECFEPAARIRKLARESNVDEIARDGHMVRVLVAKVARDGVKRVAAMDAMAATPPIEVADKALRREFPHIRLRQRPEMRIRQMCEHEWFAHDPLAHGNVTHGHFIRGQLACPLNYELPIRMPAAKTSTPPTTTWNAAARNGVSI